MKSRRRLTFTHCEHVKLTLRKERGISSQLSKKRISVNKRDGSTRFFSEDVVTVARALLDEGHDPEQAQRHEIIVAAIRALGLK